MDASAPSPLRNLSLTAGKTEPDLPNRSPRPRLRSIRWVRPASDAPDIYPLGPGRKGARPVYPVMPALLGVHCADRGVLSLSLGAGVFKEPHVVLSLVNDRARQYLDGLQPGDYFAYVLITSHNEMAIVSFDLKGGLHQPIISIEDGALQGSSVNGTAYAPAPINVHEQANQTSGSVPANYTPAPVNVGDQAQQGAGTSGSAHSPAPLLVGDQAALLQALLSGEARPIVTISESASQMLTNVGGEHFLAVHIQTLLESAASDLVTGTGSYGTSDVTVVVGDQGQLGFVTAAGFYHNMFPMDSMESYTSGDFLNGLADGRMWTTSYTARTNFTGIQASDMFVDYTDGAELHGLNLGHWTQTGAYVARDNFFGAPRYDTFESYTDGADLNGLNGGYVGYTGSGFSGAYVAKENFIRVMATDPFQTYAVEDPLTSSLADGYGWGAAWSFPDASTNNVVFSGGGAADTFDDYASESPVTSSLNSGTGWSGAWVIV